jgi:hypothetical protein
LTTPGRLTVNASTGHVEGPAEIAWNDPFPCVNGSYGSGAMMGVLMHTEVGSEGGTVSWFNNPAAQASAHFAIGRDGAIHQFGPVGKSWEAWHAAEANSAWYGIEFEDDQNPGTPLTAAQVTASAQLVECLSAFAGFPLQVSNSPSVKGYGIHSMGGQAWGGHFQCPGSVRAAQRPAIIALAVQIRKGNPSPAWTYEAPRNLQAVGGHDSVKLTWKPPAGARVPPSAYRVWVYRGTVCDQGTLVSSYPRTARGCPWQGGSLARGQEYTARVAVVAPAAHVKAGVFADVAFTTG